MIGIVIVSHSPKIAEGVVELANQMSQGQVPLAAAGGIDDPVNTIGTDAFRIQEAIEQVYSDDGVLVLMDLGSAIISTQTALEFLSPEQAANVRLCSAPIIEGAVAAAVEAISNSNLDEIATAALGGLTGKQAEINDVNLAALSPAPVIDLSAAKTLRLIVPNANGLHARPAAQFVSTVKRFQADVTVTNQTKNKGPVNAKSINLVPTITARQGDEILITAQGPDADQLLAAVEALARKNFGDVDEEIAPTPAAPATRFLIPAEPQISGIAASPGIAVGPIAHYEAAKININRRSVANPEAEWQRLEQALAQARSDLEALAGQAHQQAGQTEAAIFEVHQAFLEDAELIDPAKARIFDEQINAEAAWQEITNEMAQRFQDLEEELFQARAADILDVGQRVLRILTGVKTAGFALTAPAIIVAADLSPSDTAQFDPAVVLGLITELGTPTSHTAILARALGIPAIVGATAAFASLQAGTVVGMDGSRGAIWLDPSLEIRQALETQRQEWQAARAAAQAASLAPATTRDGQPVEVVANIGGVDDLEAALQNGAEGVGLFRTEFLFLDRTTAPTEMEQYEAYRAVADKLGRRPLVIRTLDIGGDKPLPYMNLPKEENPFLGWRGIRIGLDEPGILKTQLRAILRASPEHNIKIMFPMVATLDEVRRAKQLLAEAQAELEQAGVLYERDIELGVMIEIPAAVAVADLLAAEVDFFSIGTNDLSQYTMASDRTNAKVAALADTFQPAVLRLIQQTIQAAHAAGIWVGLCGEFAGKPEATPILLGFGLDEFSMSPPAIPEVKQRLRALTVAEAEAIATEVVLFKTATEVRLFIDEL